MQSNSVSKKVMNILYESKWRQSNFVRTNNDIYIVVNGRNQTLLEKSNALTTVYL